MENYRIFLSVGVVLLFLAVNSILKKYINQRIQKYLPRTAKNFPINSLLNLALVLVLVLAVVSIWGVSINNLWIYLTSVLTLIAIGFFAVWSILSNIIAGLILLGSKRFTSGDEIIIYPEKIKGSIVNITLFFVVLKDSKGYTVNLPNNMFFQRLTKVKSRQKKLN
jgi:MscS family membrane protein